MLGCSHALLGAAALRLRSSRSSGQAGRIPQLPYRWLACLVHPIPPPPTAQGDGTAQLLCRGAAQQAEVCHIIEADFPGMACMPFTVPATTGAAPAAADAASAAGCLVAPLADEALPAANGNTSAANGAAEQPAAGLDEQLQQSLAAVAAKQKELQAAQQRLAELQAAAAARGQ